MKFFFVTHIIGFIACTYREMYSAKTDLFAQIMRIVEIFCIPLHLSNILLSVELLSVILIREHTDDLVADMDAVTSSSTATEDMAKSTIFLMDKCPRSDFKVFGGQVFEWMIIEISIYMFFIMTHLILMIKSRFVSVGMDNSEQFEPTGMRFLTQKIIRHINLKEEDAFFLNKERMVLVEGVPLKISLDQSHIDAIREKKAIVDLNSTEWVQECLVGHITKDELDEERIKETNSLDMMQNSSIIYHTESILEMQTACLIMNAVLTSLWRTNQQYGVKSNEYDGPMSALGVGVWENTYIIVYILLGEHIISYLFNIYRNNELSRRGVPNSRGVMTAPVESKLRYVEIFMDILIFAYVILHIVSLSQEQIHDMPLLNYIIIVDMIIMFFTLPYVYFSQFIMVEGEITKNIFTLYQVQRKKLRERRNQAQVGSSEWREFFVKQAKKSRIAAEKKLGESKKKPQMVFKGQQEKLKKPKNKTMSDMINQENRRNEEHDLTSDSSESSSDTDSDQGEALAKENGSKEQVVMREEDFEENEKLTFTKDVYNYTICANMTKCCSPLQQGFALKQCFIVFGVQILVPVFFLLEFGVSGFVKPTSASTAIRIICSLLLHMIIYGEVKQAINILRYLKYVKTAKGGKRGRFINILLCSMQMISPFFTEIVLILAICQTESLPMIIKSFVALGFVIKIDDMFSENFPKEIKDTASDLELIIGKDQNSYKKILKRIKSARK
mmetsp:Transcript_8499/g.14296  ORF Transcript_8499/g.14296 Transcript_8499/m.14296 type:complete len:728 (+) Transcript_8499:520-2703(+)|eukprot:CAMPEP_0168614372 /NCGR_PEP_ID=MMETSP0449_2-20121227/3938_1 /TAXON_ID=1082188 /ORGANISM="Strombidium rassoulzadegani, Strain ras09" /LENGTH=727 /DNA_ID=CAMNT_0008655045 /DNA_START=438 /DNA_END=2621 /DNA_ORIENTATION=+